MTIVVLRLSSQGPYVGMDDNGNRVVYDPRLMPPIEIGSRINAEQYGQIIRGEANAGVVEVALDEDFWHWLNLGWKGRVFRIKKGNDDDLLENFELLYTGRVNDIEWEATNQSQKLSIKTTNAELDLDSVLVSELYDSTSLEAIKGKPKPFLRGTVYSVEPVLEDEVEQIYRLSSGANIEEIMRVMVGGVEWDESESFPPGGGEWWSDLPAGVFYLGSDTDGGEVRVDCRAVGWDECTSAVLMQEIVELGGGQVDDISFDQFQLDAPELVGIYQGTESINRLDVLDIIANGIGGWWFFGENEKIYAGVIAAPDTETDFLLTNVEIDDLYMTGILSPAWRIRVEWKRNWQPVSNFFANVSIVDQQSMKSGGIIETYENEGIKIDEPKAIDVPLIRSLVYREIDAEAILNRLVSAWGERRYVYEITAKSDVPRLYSTIEVDFLMVEGFFRLHSSVWSIGGGLSKFQVWGAANVEIPMETSVDDEDDDDEIASSTPAIRFIGGAFVGVAEPVASLIDFALPTADDPVDTVMMAGWMGYADVSVGHNLVLVYNNSGSIFVGVSVGDGSTIAVDHFAFFFNFVDVDSELFQGYIDIPVDLRDGWHSFAISIRASTQTIQFLVDGTEYVVDPGLIYISGTGGSFTDVFNALWQFCGASSELSISDPNDDVPAFDPVFDPVFHPNAKPFAPNMSFYTFWMGFGEAFFDLTDSGNVDLLIGSGNTYVDWGDQGQNLTGSAPPLYFKGDTTTFYLNYGTSGSVVQSPPGDWTDGGPGQIYDTNEDFLPPPPGV